MATTDRSGAIHDEKGRFSGHRGARPTTSLPDYSATSAVVRSAACALNEGRNEMKFHDPTCHVNGDGRVELTLAHRCEDADTDPNFLAHQVSGFCDDYDFAVNSYDENHLSLVRITDDNPANCEEDAEQICKDLSGLDSDEDAQRQWLSEPDSFSNAAHEAHVDRSLGL